MIQNANTSHAVEAYRLRAGIRASVRVGRRIGCASPNEPNMRRVGARKTRRMCSVCVRD